MSPLNITQPLGIWMYMVYNGYYKVMSNIPKMGHLPTPVFGGDNFLMEWCHATSCATRPRPPWLDQVMTGHEKVYFFMPLGRYINIIYIYIYTQLYAHIMILTIIVVVMINLLIFILIYIYICHIIIAIVIHILLPLLLLLLLCYRDGSSLGVLWSVRSNQLRPAAKML